MNTNAHAAVVIGSDIDPVDGPITLDANFSFGGDTTVASDSIPSAAVGTDGFGSLFGGNGTAVDTYVYTYDVDVLADNLALAAGTALNDDGDASTGLAAGGTGTYNIYATWPITNTVSGGNTTYTLTDDMGSTLFSVSIDQNTINGFVDPANGQTFAGGEWVPLSSATLDATKTYTLTQESGAATFVSMRSAGILFEPVPEPSSILLFAMCAVYGVCLRRR
jgi:hypothetical protein